MKEREREREINWDWPQRTIGIGTFSTDATSNAKKEWCEQRDDDLQNRSPQVIEHSPPVHPNPHRLDRLRSPPAGGGNNISLFCMEWWKSCKICHLKQTSMTSSLQCPGLLLVFFSAKEQNQQIFCLWRWDEENIFHCLLFPGKILTENVFHCLSSRELMKQSFVCQSSAINNNFPVLICLHEECVLYSFAQMIAAELPGA